MLNDQIKPIDHIMYYLKKFDVFCGEIQKFSKSIINKLNSTLHW